MQVQGPISEAGPVANVATGNSKAPAGPGEEVRVVRTPPVVVIAQPKSPPREDPRELTARIAERLEQFLKDSGRNVEYRVDADAGATVITVRRSDTGEVVRQFPSEEALAWLKRLNEQSGTFVDALA